MWVAGGRVRADWRMDRAFCDAVKVERADWRMARAALGALVLCEWALGLHSLAEQPAATVSVTVTR